MSYDPINRILNWVRYQKKRLEWKRRLNVLRWTKYRAFLLKGVPFALILDKDLTPQGQFQRAWWLRNLRRYKSFRERHKV